MKMDFTYHIICIMSHYRCAFNFLFTVCVDVHAKATASDNVESMVAGRLSNVFYVNSEHSYATVSFTTTTSIVHGC